MNEDQRRLYAPEMTYYREVYKNSPKWDGTPGKRLIIYCEQGLGDTIQFARYFKYLNCHTILHCQKPLHRLMLTIEGVNEVIDKSSPSIPSHDCHVLSFSLPFILQKIEADIPYITSEPTQLPAGRKIGISWEGSPAHLNNVHRSCPLKWFAELQVLGTLYMLQDKVYTHAFIQGAEDIEMYSKEMKDLLDTANLIAAMDIVVTVDTAILHLAGAIGKKTYGLLSTNHDARWDKTNWYPSVNLLKQGRPGDWEPLFKSIIQKEEKKT